MATEDEVMGEDMRRVHRSFAKLLEDDRFAFVLSGRILGFDATCAHPVSAAPIGNRALPDSNFLFRRTKMFHVIYGDPGKEDEDAWFDQHEPWATARKGILAYGSTFYARYRDRCW
jgi:hypothetical protein